MATPVGPLIGGGAVDLRVAVPMRGGVVLGTGVEARRTIHAVLRGETVTSIRGPDTVHTA